MAPAARARPRAAAAALAVRLPRRRAAPGKGTAPRAHADALAHALDRLRARAHDVSGVTKALVNLLVHYYFCVYCFTTGDYCGHCSSYNQFQRVAPGGQSGNLGRYAQKGKPAG